MEPEGFDVTCQLVYVSKASREITTEELEDLLENARKKNGAVDVTGLLLVREDAWF